jgi:hypothetical protein
MESGRRIAIDGARCLREGAASRRVFIRTNDPRSPSFEDDVDAVASASIDGLIVPKVERTSDVLDLEAYLADAERAPGGPPLALVTGTSRASACSAPSTSSRRASGRAPPTSAETTSPPTSGHAVRPAETRCCTRGHTSRWPLASPESTRSTRASSRFATTGVSWTTRREEIDWSRRVLAAYRAGLRAGRAAIEVDGVMVDGPLVKRAESVLALADATDSPHAERDGCA